MLSVFGGDFARNPWPVLRELRAENGGVHRVVTPDGPPAWLVTRHGDVRSGLLDERLVTDLRHARGDDYKGFAVPPPMDVFSRSDSERLGRLRRSITAELHPGRLGQWGELVETLVSPLVQQLDTDPFCDFVERVAIPLPADILEQLLGLPPAAGNQLRRWAESTLRPGMEVRARDTLATMRCILDEAIAHGRRNESAMIGRLVHSGSLDEGEVIGLLFYLLFVWYEVLTDLLAGAVAAFSDNPAQLEMFMRTEPVKAVDELIRYLSPQVTASPRFATEDLVIQGHSIKAGQTVLLSLASANHDEDVFEDPEVLDVGRSSTSHVGFGYGAHACVGTGLVRPVAAAALSRIYTRWPNLRLAKGSGELLWRNGFRHRGPLALPVAVR